eukprot:Gb_00410 [translate_table: standard]
MCNVTGLKIPIFCQGI